MTGYKVVKRSIIMIESYKTRITLKEVEDIYRAAFGWQMPTYDVAATFLMLNGYITEQERNYVLNIMKGVAVNG